MNALTLHYRHEGNGPPMLCVHGFGASTYTWHAVRDVLAAGHEVFEIDLKGFGESPKPRDGRYSVRDQAALVMAFLRERRLRQVALVGHSMGGGVALAVAADVQQNDPDLLSSMILIDAASYRQSLPSFIAILTVPILGVLSQYLLPSRSQVRIVLKKAYFDDRLIPRASVEAYAKLLREPGGKYALRQTARQLIPPDLDALSAQYARIHLPTLIIWGRHDEIVPVWAGERLHDAISGSTFLVIENAGHVPHEETPEPVRVAVTKFFEANPPASAG